MGNGLKKYVALHLGVLFVYLFYWMSCFIYGLEASNISGRYLKSIQPNKSTHKNVYLNPNQDSHYFNYFEPFTFEGLSGGRNDIELLFVILGLYIFTIILWIRLAIFQTDPGKIDTRSKDFDKV
jgi:hypothetical protein